MFIIFIHCRSKVSVESNTPQQSCGVFDLRRIRQISVQARLLGSLLRGNKKSASYMPCTLGAYSFFCSYSETKRLSKDFNSLLMDATLSVQMAYSDSGNHISQTLCPGLVLAL